MAPDPRRPRRSEPSGNLLQAELLQEKAANLGRLARRLDGALKALEAHDAAASCETPKRGSASCETPDRGSASDSPAGAKERAALLADAGDALFLYVVQREVLGLRGTAQALDDLGVPREVRLRMAPRSVLLAR